MIAEVRRTALQQTQWFLAPVPRTESRRQTACAPDSGCSIHPPEFELKWHFSSASAIIKLFCPCIEYAKFHYTTNYVIHTFEERMTFLHMHDNWT